jgi:hypothetical protein
MTAVVLLLATIQLMFDTRIAHCDTVDHSDSVKLVE